MCTDSPGKAVRMSDEEEHKAEARLWSGTDLMSRNSSETQESSVASHAALTVQTQCLRFETITDRESRVRRPCHHYHG